MRQRGLLLHPGLASAPWPPAADVASDRRVAVVNRTLVKNYFGSDDPIGRQIKFNVLDEIPRTPHNAYFEIIGVVNDFRNYGLQESTHPEAYTPYTFTGFGDRSLVVRTSVNPMSLVNNIRQVVSAVDGNVVLNHPGPSMTSCRRMSI